MLIQLNDWLLTGRIAPFHWGISKDDLCRILPSAQGEIDELLAAGFPYVVLDGVEFYFTGNTFEDLAEIVIQTWKLDAKHSSTYFDYGWLQSGLKNAQVHQVLKGQNVSYKTERGPHFQTPNLRTSKGILFAFYSDFEHEPDAELMNVYLVNPE
jgi:hypothetical protein